MSLASEPVPALRRLAGLGSVPGDTPDEKLRKETLVLSASLIASLAVVWVITYWLLDLYMAAAIPLSYQVVSIVNLAVFARTKRYRFFRSCALGLNLLLPVLLQVSLGGFIASSGVVLWSFTAPLGALLFAGRRQAVGWFAAFVVALALAGGIDPLLDSRAADIPTGIMVLFFVLNVFGVTVTCYALLHYFVSERERYADALAAEQERSERLLLNVLPEPIALRLKSGESPIADGVSDVGVLFADIVDFTPMSKTMSPDGVVGMLNEIFSFFDGLAVRHRLEKIKTIGDAYMVASGLLDPHPKHAEDIAEMALAMRDEVSRQGSGISLRIGIDIGPVIAGVIGQSKFIYDLWGDTVNTASRMESHGVSGSIQVTERAAARLSARFMLEERGLIDVKGKGPMKTYFLLGPRESQPAGSEEDAKLVSG
jgi:adenylate cyclase